MFGREPFAMRSTMRTANSKSEECEMKVQEARRGGGEVCRHGEAQGTRQSGSEQMAERVKVMAGRGTAGTKSRCAKKQLSGAE